MLGRLAPGPANAITDVPGVSVGHCTVVSGEGALVRGVTPVRTGVTAVLPHGDDLFAAKVPAAAEVFNGFGKSVGLVQIAELGELETPILLTNTLSVGRAADALVGWMIERHPAIGDTATAVRPGARQAEPARVERRIGRQDDDRRAPLASARNAGVGVGSAAVALAPAQRAPHRHAADRQVAAPPEVGQHQRPERVGPARRERGGQVS